MSIGQDSKSLLATATAMLSHRVELLGIEFAEERQRIVKALGFAVAAAVFAILLVVGLSFILLLLLWETQYRFAAIGGLCVIYALLALFCIAQIKQSFTTMPFASTLQVFKDDAAKFKGEAIVKPYRVTPTEPMNRPSASSEE